MISRIILNLMMLQSILTKLEVEDMKTVHETLLGEKQDVVINPMGPLNLFRGYIGRQGAYMYNKRFFSPEIDTDYALSKAELSNENKQEYDFKRTPVNDRVYKDIATQIPNGKYLSTYHTQLIKMFPSTVGEISIEADRPDALTNFLRADHVKKDTKYMLAALLLLSEGVDIKIDVDHTGEKKKLVIKSKTCEEKEFVNVEMYTAGIDPVTNKYSESIYQSETAEIVDFYLQCRDNPLLKKGGEFAMPATKEQFESGKFLNSAAFLIQTYIYEFFDTVENYVSFVNAVHELLVDQVVEKENPEQTKKENESKIFDEFFIAKEALNENIKYTTSFCNLIRAKNENVAFPFYNYTQLPRFTRVPQCKLDKSGFELDQSLYYSDYVESAMLALFCCLAYNQKTGEYETSHMGEGISKELKEFFKKYPRRTELIDFEMHKEWSKVVACLKNDKIGYKQGRNGLLCEFSNIFLAIAEITGQKKEILELVEYIESVGKTGKIDINQKSHITVKVNLIIKSLSLNKNLKVECLNMRLWEMPSGNTDIILSLNIVYSFGNIYRRISLNIKKGLIDLSLGSYSSGDFAGIKENVKGVRDAYSDVDCHIGYIIAHYIDEDLIRISNNPNIIFQDIKRDMNTMLQEKSPNLCKMFLKRELLGTSAKRYIIERFVFGALDKEVTPTSPLARFTANILGSEYLAYSGLRNNPNFLLSFLVDWREFYPKLGYTPFDYPSEHTLVWEKSMDLYKKMFSAYPAPIMAKAACSYLRESLGCDTQSRHAKSFITSTLLFNYIMSDGKIDNLMEIQSCISEYMCDQELIPVYFCWFVHLCTGKYKFSPESIKKIYSFVYSDAYPDESLIQIEIKTREEFEKCLSVLEERKALFCSEDDPESMKKYNGLVKYIKENCLGMFPPSRPQKYKKPSKDQKYKLM
ncbi:hypothetical protein NEAUS03_1679 [Nematocida ausubeli]|nr:hypothetical protein NEAUS03_1679 [Nematocida ausubeli]